MFDLHSVQRDRDSVTSGKTRGGGLMVITVKSDLDSSLVSVENRNVEHIFVKLKIGHLSFIFDCVYIPPRSDLSVYYDHLRALRSFKSALRSVVFN